MDFDRVLALLRALSTEGVDYVLVGGVALGLHGLIRATEGVDLFIRPEPGNVARLRRALRSTWDDPAIDEIAAEDLAGAYPTIRYGPPDETVVIDLIGRLGDAVRFDDLAVEHITIDGVPVALATPRTLYRMKRDTMRPIDRADAAALREKFGLDDE